MKSTVHPGWALAALAIPVLLGMGKTLPAPASADGKAPDSTFVAGNLVRGRKAGPIDAPPGSAPGTPRGGEPAQKEALRIALERSLPVGRWTRSRWGVLVVSLDRGDTLFARDAHRPLVPASNAKLLTSAAALHYLRPEFRYETFLLSGDPVVGGVLHGDLVLYGTGDPSLARNHREDRTDPLRLLARKLHRQGVRAIRGDVVGDGTYFTGPDIPPTWKRSNLNDWFAAPASALSYEGNTTTLRISSGIRPGAPLRVTTDPAEAAVEISVIGRTVAGRPGRPVWALRDDPADPVEIVGEMSPSSRTISRRIPVPDPPLYAAARLRALLIDEGIEVVGSARSVENGDASLLGRREVWAPGFEEDAARPRVLARIESPPLGALLATVNQESNNLFAEAIFRTLGRVVEGEGSFAGGSRVLQRYLVEEVGLPPGEVRPVDGSGLSPSNRVSPYGLIRILEAVLTSENRAIFLETLPEAGRRRGLRRMYRSPAAGNLRAKTGTLDRVSALSGIVRTREGETLLFSIVSNDVPSTGAAKRIEDRIGVELAAFRRSGPSARVGGEFQESSREF